MVFKRKSTSDDSKTLTLDTLLLRVKSPLISLIATITIKKYEKNKFQIGVVSDCGSQTYVLPFSVYDGCVFEVSCLDAVLSKFIQLTNTTILTHPGEVVLVERTDILGGKHSLEETELRAMHSSSRSDEEYGSVDQWYNKMILEAEYEHTPLKWSPICRNASKNVSDLFGTAFSRIVIVASLVDEPQIKKVAVDLEEAYLQCK